MNCILKKCYPFIKNGLLYSDKNLKRKSNFLIARLNHDNLDCEESEIKHEEDELSNPEYSDISNEYIGILGKGHRVLVIQPWIKFGSKKKTGTTNELLLAESVALVSTLPYWTVVEKTCISLPSFEKKFFFGSGQIENIKRLIQVSKVITAVFISVNTLKHMQIMELEKIFGLPIFDRYSIVIHIFRNHAKTSVAKLQVALAELPYIYQKMSEINGRVNLLEKKKLYLHSRESKLKGELEKLKQQRDLVRQKRKVSGRPTVAVVGYTNAGKTTLIKALTGDEKMQPKNHLFATLDTTAHMGYLPCLMKVSFIDTIGFIQDVPEFFLEPFKTTLEDALFADVIVHVYDASHPDKDNQVEHVRKTLETLSVGDCPIIEVANKCDLIEKGSIPEEVLGISASKSIGIDLLLQKVEKLILNQEGRTFMKMRVKSGSPSSQWLYKETTVLKADADPKNYQYLLMDVIITDEQMHKFRRFLRNNKNA